MSENMFDVRKNNRRSQIIEDNLDVADKIISTNPNTTLLQNEAIFKDAPLEEDITANEEYELPVESEEINDVISLDLLNHKKKDSEKGKYTYYLDNEIDELLVAISHKYEMKSKSTLANLLLGTTLLLNENIQILSENDREINESFGKLFNKFKKK